MIKNDKHQIGGWLLNRIADRLGVSADPFAAVSDERLAAELTELVSGSMDRGR